MPQPVTLRPASQTTRLLRAPPVRVCAGFGNVLPGDFALGYWGLNRCQALQGWTLNPRVNPES